MDKGQILDIIDKFLGAWNSQDVELVIGCYTEDVIYNDPNTHGPVKGHEALRHYLRKLFAAWTMTWSLREEYLFGDGNGCAALWHATFKKTGGSKVVEADGMDLVLMRGDRIKRNDVYFDRSLLATLAQF